MTVERNYFGQHQTIYTLRDGAAVSCTLMFDARGDGEAAWKILLPGPKGTDDLYGTRVFAAPDSSQMQAWLAPIVGHDEAAELADAVDAEPPHQGAWVRHDAK